MTTVTIYKNSKKQYTGFHTFGHADYAKKSLFYHEPDVLCASISSLVINTLNCLEELTGEIDNMDQDTNEKTGFIKCYFKKPITNEKSVVLLDAMVFGLQKLSKEYGTKYLQVKFEEV
ncbi:MAG: ribosomal-processing cysteine protease Prp [Lachnospiraceae bacterium]|nr:ribosomal-processing cysteine protease Prp [Lachnospiraceae bacterium]